jgi:RNA polymerase sigma-70 factor (ECF subfamily)
MISSGSTTRAIQQCLLDLHAGDEAAREQLIAVSQKRLLVLARRMFQQFPRLRAWEETDDVMQSAMLRLHRSLAEISPGSVRDYLALASLQIRRTLLDLARHYFGPQGLGCRQNHMPGASPSTNWFETALADTSGPESLAEWSEFHQQVAALEDEDRELFDLLWYQGLTQAEAAEVLRLSERTVRRKWFAARQRLQDLGFDASEWCR